jgi:hypothetical protein
VDSPGIRTADEPKIRRGDRHVWAKCAGVPQLIAGDIPQIAGARWLENAMREEAAGRIAIFLERGARF